MGATSSGQGTAGGDGGQQQGDQQGGEATGTGPDFGAVQEALTQLQGGQEQMREFLQSQPWQQLQEASQHDDGSQEPAELQPPDLDLGFLDPMEAAAMEPQELQQRLTQTIQQQAQHVAQQMLQSELGPLRDDIAEMRSDQAISALVGEFPELGEEDTANKMVGAADQLAKQFAPSLAHSMGNPALAPQIAQALANDPGFWKTTYLAGRALDAAQQEDGDIPAAATLESGAGATPGGGGGDLGDQIVGAGRGGSSVLPFH